MQELQSTSSQPISETLQEPQSRTIDSICPEHGAYVAKVTEYHIGVKPTVITSRCPSCVEEQNAREADREAREKAAQRQHKVSALFGKAFIPSRFSGRSFTDYHATEDGQRIALAVCKGFADKWQDRAKAGASLVLTGGPGTGKTHLACAIANQVIESEMASVKFGTVASMLRYIKATYSRDSQKTEQDAIDDLVSPDLLILDEVGVQVGSEHEKMLMFEVLNERYQELRPTILISNLDVSELEDFMGHRVMDRYRECGSILAFNWDSHRGANQ